jgi:hypothetical protein
MVVETWKKESEKRAELGECAREQEMPLLLRVRKLSDAQSECASRHRA